MSSRTASTSVYRRLGFLILVVLACACREGRDRAGADGVGEDGRVRASDRAGAAPASTPVLRLRDVAEKVDLFLFSICIDMEHGNKIIPSNPYGITD